MKIALILEGDTERAFLPALRNFLEERLARRMPRLTARTQNGRIPTHARLKILVTRLLTDPREGIDAVIALTDVYTGGPHFQHAADAKQKMREWVGGEQRFFPHAAQHDFEAWLLVYWDRILELSGSRRHRPVNPEKINHNRPPAKLLKEVFRTGSKGRPYLKPREAKSILDGQDLSIAAAVCPELKAFLNTILTLSGGAPLP